MKIRISPMKLATGLALIPLLSLPAFAQSGNDLTQNELRVPLARYRIQGQHSNQFSIGTGNTGITYGRSLTNFLALQVEGDFLAFSSTDQNPGGARWTITAGPSFKFAIDETGIKNAFFVTLAGGIHYAYIDSLSLSDTTYATDSQSSMSFAYLFEVGKAFSILPNVSWSPGLSISGFLGNDLFNFSRYSNPQFQLSLVRISILF